MLREGDVVLGFDLTNAPWALETQVQAQNKAKALPDIILVRKVEEQNHY